MKTYEHPLSWYIEKLETGDPFASYLYGDGEMLAASRQRLGETLQNGEVVTEDLAYEIGLSLEDPAPEVVRGTDLNLINYPDYGGRDKKLVVEMGEKFAPLFRKCPKWADGVVWERAVRAGKFGPCFRALGQRDLILIGNPALWGNSYLQPVLKPRAVVSVPPRNACAALDKIERDILHLTTSSHTVYVACTGLGAIPLLQRLRAHVPHTCSFLDLGSTFDVFCGLGTERGWRQEVYADPARHRHLLEANLEGSI